MDSSSRLQESESSDAESDNAPLLKTNRNKKSKRAERTPLLASNHGEGSSQTASGIEPAAAIRGRTGTETSDDDTVCFSGSEHSVVQSLNFGDMFRYKPFTDNERYGSVSGGYAGVLVEAHRAMNHGIFPERIPQGSSGSYFVKNLRGQKIGVFKPKNEEPYGALNPKWMKFFQKCLCPCCFGRGCLLPNQGYLSEAGASLVDQKLGLNVVPKTAVVAFAAPTFNYSALDRGFARSKERIRSRYPDLGRRFRRIGLPPKKGSFQLFVSGYEDATYWLRQWDISPEQAPPPATRQQFKIQFERLVILDYIIRNTDRGNDNWLIKYELAEARPITDTSGSVKSNTGSPVPPRDKSPEPPAIQEDVIVDLSDSGNPVPGNDAPLGGDAQVQTSNTDVTSVEPNLSEISMPTETPVVLSAVTSEADLEHVSMPTVAIAAIDNGLAFPFKHPDEWRSYPYQWSALPIAQEPFSEETINEFLPKLDDTDFVRELGQDLKRIFETDKSFNMRMFNKQLSVMRGQIFNLREALRSRKTPYQLVMMPPQYMIEVKRKHVRPSNVLHVRTSGEESHSGLSDSAVGHSDVAGPSSTSAPIATQANDESDPKSWNNTFKQKVQTRSAFFRMW